MDLRRHKETQHTDLRPLIERNLGKVEFMAAAAAAAAAAGNAEHSLAGNGALNGSLGAASAASALNAQLTTMNCQKVSLLV